MSQCLRNLLDRHQKTGMEAAHVSLTKRRKSPAPDVQLIQPQRQEQTPATKKQTKAEKSTCPPAPKKEKVCWADPSILFDLTKHQVQILNRNAEERKSLQPSFPAPWSSQKWPPAHDKDAHAATQLLQISTAISPHSQCPSQCTNHLYKSQKFNLGITLDTGLSQQQCQVITKLYRWRSLPVSHLVYAPVCS